MDSEFHNDIRARRVHATRNGGIQGDCEREQEARYAVDCRTSELPSRSRTRQAGHRRVTAVSDTLLGHYLPPPRGALPCAIGYNGRCCPLLQTF